MLKTIQRLAAIALLGLVPVFAAAQEGGAVEVTINDTAYVFPLWENQSDWSGTVDWGSVNIYTRPLDEDTWALFKEFTLGFQFAGGNIDGGEASLNRMVDGTLVYYYANDTGMTIAVEGMSADGDCLTLSGTAEMTMRTSENWGNDIDMSDPPSLSAAFTLTLGPVE